MAPSPMAPSPAAQSHPASCAPQALAKLPKTLTRLTRRAEFLRVAAKGRKAPAPGLVLQALRRDDHAPVRLGFTVTKKVGNAVVRNRTRRRLRAAIHDVMQETPLIGLDLVLVGRDATRARPFDALKQDLRQTLSRLGAL